MKKEHTKKNALLVMAATGNYLFSVANVLMGLKKYSPTMFDDIIIYIDDTALQSDKEIIQKIFPVKFKKYDFQLDSADDVKRLTYYSNMPYARFEMPTYLNEYHRVVWFDSDFLITGDVSGILKYDRTGLSMSIDLDPYPVDHGVYKFFVKDVPGYTMDALAYASGLIMFSDKLPVDPETLRKYLYSKVNKYSGYLRFAEQGILQMMIEDFNLKVDMFPKLKYHAFPFEDKSNARLIHFLGEKPWIKYNGNAYDEWYENHKKWISLGGSEAFTFVPIIKRNISAFYGENRYQNILQMDAINSGANTTPASQVYYCGMPKHWIKRHYYHKKYMWYRFIKHISFGKYARKFSRKSQKYKDLYKSAIKMPMGGVLNNNVVNAPKPAPKPVPKPAPVVAQPKYKFTGTGNKLLVLQDGKYIEHTTVVRGLVLNINGNNNVIKLDDLSVIQGSLTITMIGSNSSVHIGKNTNKTYPAKILGAFFIMVGNNTSLDIGDNIVMNVNCSIFLGEPNSKCVIGNNVRISENVRIFATDGHPVVDVKTKKVLNYGYGKRVLTIGNNCWIAQGSYIGKKACLSDYTIVSACSVVIKPQTEPYSIVAGNPAKVVKSGVMRLDHWNEAFELEKQANNN